ncbi:prolyl oligopeptidase family serine peptidase [Corallococcus sp. bb12-1]|uniref:alpha/beta hydrolase n=1 Tax=Corallococcus sp. bb12-1 TaxID=2996784 RepID=UPI00226FFE65|nr:prolyl oligopeptidase family serine peptidase [Corallococcus sp. bb12-1]MCY1043297.1 prolyl oligopeptidase family serine peptidase [Corallococcus sp. bb12-1]
MKPLNATAPILLSLLATACATSLPGPASPGASPPLFYKTYTLGAEKPEALLVALHYSGSTPDFWDEHVTTLDTAVRVVLPRGARPHRAGFTWFPVEHEKRDSARKTAEVERVATQLADIVREVRRAHPEIRRVAVTGFSYGGDLAWMLALRHPELVDVAVPMGTRLLGEPARSLPPSHQVLVLQGEDDSIIPLQQTLARVAHLKAVGVPIDVRTYPGVGHDVSPLLLEDWRGFLRQALQETGAAPRP